MKIKVTILSFSYRRGIPEDPTGNGGGFVFDCRAMPNPFWEEPLRYYTGCDRPIADFFARFPEKVEPFLHATETLVLQTIDEFRTSARNHIQVAFGCTGGQHRSVYFAERLAQILRTVKDVDVEVRHTAELYWETNAKE